MYLVRLARRWLGLRMCSHKTTYTTVASQPAALECSDCRIIMSSFQSKQLQWQPSRIQNLLFWRQLIKSVTKKIINILQNRISTQNFLSLLHTLRVYYCMGEDVDGSCRGGWRPVIKRALAFYFCCCYPQLIVGAFVHYNNFFLVAYSSFFLWNFCGCFRI